MGSESKKTILLVEDEEILAVSGEMFLRKYGYNVITAECGEAAIEIFRKNPMIDLILMDIDLGDGMDGTEAAKTILKERHIPIVFLSSHTEQEIVEKTEKITSYGYVVKNSGITVLDESIKMAFKLFEAYEKLNNELTERRRIEEDLLKSKQQYDSLVSKIPVGIYVLHSKNRDEFALDYLNSRMAEIFDVDVEDFLKDAKLIYKFIHPDEFDDFEKLNEEGIPLLRPFDWKGRVLVNGAIKWLHIGSAPEQLEDGEVLWNGLIVD
ncbi:MAG: response regulator, partial [Syntrophothermus sp.]